MNGGLEVSDVEDRQLQVDVAPMADAIVQIFAAGQAIGILLTGPHAVVQDSIRDGGTLGILKMKEIKRSGLITGKLLS